jgi:hypothetical protein
LRLIAWLGARASLTVRRLPAVDASNSPQQVIVPHDAVASEKPSVTRLAMA